MLEANISNHLRGTKQRITQVMREKVDEFGLTFRLLHIIMLIDKNPETNQKELAEQMRLTQGALSGSIKRLIKLGILEQIPLEEDLRYNRLVITEHGRSLINDWESHIVHKYKELFVGFTQDELEEFDRALLKINANLDRMEARDERSSE